LKKLEEVGENRKTEKYVQIIRKKVDDGTRASVEGANKCSAQVEQENCCEK